MATTWAAAEAQDAASGAPPCRLGWGFLILAGPGLASRAGQYHQELPLLPQHSGAASGKKILAPAWPWGVAGLMVALMWDEPQEQGWEALHRASS